MRGMIRGPLFRSSRELQKKYHPVNEVKEFESTPLTLETDGTERVTYNLRIDAPSFRHGAASEHRDSLYTVLCYFHSIATNHERFNVHFPYVSYSLNKNASKDMWHKLEAHCNRRARCIEEFRVELESVEVLRSQAVEKELRRLVDDMLSTAYRMPGEIERIAEVKGPESACECFHRATDNSSAESLSQMYVSTCIIRNDCIHESV